MILTKNSKTKKNKSDFWTCKFNFTETKVNHILLKRKKSKYFHY
jgi:hypothetical protein